MGSVFEMTRIMGKPTIFYYPSSIGPWQRIHCVVGSTALEQVY